MRLGPLRRITPLRRHFGHQAGKCIDRYYIERFLQQNAVDIRGRTLEIQDAKYTRMFSGDAVERADVLHVEEDNPEANIVADLTRADHLDSNTYDCMILTQTLQFIYDTRAALETIHRLLKPKGVLLATFPGISQIARYDMERWGDFWRMTDLAAERLFSEFFPRGQIEISSQGNVLTAVALLHGFVVDELSAEELDHHDPDYQLIITVRAVK